MYLKHSRSIPAAPQHRFKINRRALDPHEIILFFFKLVKLRKMKSN